MSRDSLTASGTTVATWIAIVAFAVLCLLRLNTACLLEPDTPDYLFTSKALATLQGYTEIDHPEQPPHAFRPPGLPLLLAPLIAIAGYNVVAAKILILATALLSLLLLAALARRWAGGVASLVVTAAVASSPFTLLHATEVITELPFLAALLTTLAIAAREEAPSRPQQMLMASLLALLPLLRTVGLVWLLALLLWSLWTRDRRFLPAIGIGMLVTLLWMARNQATGLTTYFSGMAHDFKELGLSGYLARSLDAAAFYGAGWFEVLLPGVFSPTPLYQRFLLEPANSLGGLWGLGWIAGVAITLLALIGIRRAPRAVSGAVALYLLGSVAVLLIYPPRHERLIWPLVPMVWLFAPLGLRAVAGGLAKRIQNPRTIPAIGIAVAMLLCGWQLVPSLRVVSTNLASLSAAETFYREAIPPTYYADWQAAGRWLADHAPAEARVLTRHSDLGFTSGRMQDSVRFEEISPRTLHQRITRLGATYLALPSTRFRWVAPFHLTQGSPVYRFEPVYDDRDVLILRVQPNRDGAILRVDPLLEQRVSSCEQSVRRHPVRVDLRRRLAELQHEAGRSDDALRTLDGSQNADSLLSRGRILLELDRSEEALRAFERAAAAPGHESLSGAIQRGADRARRQSAMRSRPPAERLRYQLDRARSLTESLLFHSAWRALERAEQLAPNHPEVAFYRAVLSERTGSFEAAERLYAAVARSGVSAAAERQARLRQERMLLSGEAQASATTWVGLAVARANDGMTGRALLLLEGAVAKHPGSTEAQARLTELRKFYNLSR